MTWPASRHARRQPQRDLADYIDGFDHKPSAGNLHYVIAPSRSQITTGLTTMRVDYEPLDLPNVMSVAQLST